MLQNASECSKMYVMFQNASECFEMLQYASEWCLNLFAAPFGKTAAELRNGRKRHPKAISGRKFTEVVLHGAPLALPKIPAIIDFLCHFLFFFKAFWRLGFQIGTENRFQEILPEFFEQQRATQPIHNWHAERCQRVSGFTARRAMTGIGENQKQ